MYHKFTLTCYVYGKSLGSDDSWLSTKFLCNFNEIYSQIHQGCCSVGAYSHPSIFGRCICKWSEFPCDVNYHVTPSSLSTWRAGINLRVNQEPWLLRPRNSLLDHAMLTWNTLERVHTEWLCKLWPATCKQLQPRATTLRYQIIFNFFTSNINEM